jgi:hypothetical protein
VEVESLSFATSEAEAAAESPSFATSKEAATESRSEPLPCRVGTVRHVHAEYGVFIALEDRSAVGVGDVLEVVGEGGVATPLKVRRLSRPETLYPNGAAVCDAPAEAVERGQIVRRTAP